jgi:hypothetical protein
VVLAHSRTAVLASLSLALPRRASNCRAQRSADHKQPTLIWELGANYGPQASYQRNSTNTLLRENKISIFFVHSIDTRYSRSKLALWVGPCHT